MKAYVVYDSGAYDSFYKTIVFAENATKAKLAALCTDCCEGAEYIDIRVNREPGADKLYNGKSEIDWYDMNTRLELVKNLGWSCFETSWECDTCSAKQYCDLWEKGSLTHDQL